ncbi:MAG: hypothetical protein J4451_01210 [DPANN group archaeon]|nr:hypothetical protein [DPANN group archaeon]
MKRKYKTPHSDNDTHIVYRRFHYTPRVRLDLLATVALALAFLGIYIIIPTPSDAIEVTVISGFLVNAFGTSLRASLVYGLLIYKAIGMMLLVAGFVFGGIVVRNAVTKRVDNLLDTFRK